MPSFDPITRQGLAITNFFAVELAISLALVTFVFVWMIVALVRFRARSGDAQEPPQVHGHRTVEIVWTVTPVLVLAITFVFVVRNLRVVDAAQPGAEQLRVIGHQWWWEFQYPNQQVVTANELHVPVGTPVEIDLDSVDVLHSFWVPNFGMMRDAVPGKTNQMQVLIDRAGSYAGACTQFCGLEHARMRIKVVADPPAQFQAWLTQQRQPVSPSNQPGERVFLQNTCVSCHTIAGLSSQASIGPDLTHLGSRTTIGAGVLDNTPDNLGRWIRDADAIKPGVLMPAFGNLSDDDINALVSYLESLQ